MNRKEAIEHIKWYFTEDDGMAADASVKEAIQALVPELAESEDERIRKEILEFVRTRGGFKGEWIAWLEKQKEQRNYRKLYEDIAKSEWFKKAYEGKSLGSEDKQKEQKPADLLDEIKHYLATTPKEQLRKDREEIERWYEEHMVQTQDEYSVEENPAEWSEENENEPMEIIFAGKVYKVYDIKELPGGIKGYIIQDEPGHFDCITNPDKVLSDSPSSFLNRGNSSKSNTNSPSWKPTKEQLNALHALNYHERFTYIGQQKDLISLYYDLKKL